MAFIEIEEGKANADRASDNARLALKAKELGCTTALVMHIEALEDRIKVLEDNAEVVDAFLEKTFP